MNPTHKFARLMICMGLLLEGCWDPWSLFQQPAFNCGIGQGQRAHAPCKIVLAHHLDTAIERRVAADPSAVARERRLTRARITELLDLTLLAHDLQLQVLELEAVDSVAPLAERELRRMAHAKTWPRQQPAWGGPSAWTIDGFWSDVVQQIIS